jgi:predicted aconitase
MYLTREEERILAGEAGWTKQKALEILVAIGDIHGAARLIPITSAHLSGASYKTIGDAVEFIASLKGRVAVKSTLNPTGMDRERWDSMRIPPDFMRKQQEVLEAYHRLGVSLECTCVPYLLGQPPRRGEHLAWAESSAVLYVNSVLGARTNMEGAPSALAAALIGKTPLYGLHAPANRVPAIQVCVHCPVADAGYSALGYLIGDLVGTKIPLIELPPSSRPSTDELKHLAAAIGATGSVGLYHLRGITPEAAACAELPAETIELEDADLQRFFRPLDRGDVIAIGCPHCSATELQRILGLLHAESRGRKVQKEFFIFTARAIKERMPDVVKRLEEYGVTVICDTCFVVSPAFEHFRCVITNSGKMFRYVPLLCSGAEARLCTTEECVKLAF